MNEIETYLFNLIKSPPDTISQNLFDKFVSEAHNIEAVNLILKTEKMLKEKWIIQNRISDILQQQVFVPNGTVSKDYLTKIDFSKQGWEDIVYTEFEGLETIGLEYNNEFETIQGCPNQSGDFTVLFKFRVKGEPDDSVLNEKKIKIIINPDPKSLWKNIPSDSTALYWKKDQEELCTSLGDKTLVVASKRGRSHANVGSFRDDDFSFHSFDAIGWNIVAVADGAGSSKYSREASKIACSSIIDHVEEISQSTFFDNFDQQVQNYQIQSDDESLRNNLNRAIYELLSKVAFHAHKKILDTATQSEASAKDFYTTLSFVLFKKFDFGYVFLSFGVGDSPIALLNKDQTQVYLLNTLDVGEFGGGTRFLTMPEIFQPEKFAQRLKFKIIDDFSYLFLMTDGIYDPKFGVESMLEKAEAWQHFIDDLKGNNEQECKVDLQAENPEMAQQLSTWMDFWSAGNHDDRTLAIVF